VIKGVQSADGLPPCPAVMGGMLENSVVNLCSLITN